MTSATVVVASVTIDSVVSEEQDGVRIINICALLDALFGDNGWYGLDPEIVNGAVVEWLNGHKEVFYYAWEGESFLRLAEQDSGVRKAKDAGKSVLVIEALS
jgi:hypothetical protein